MTYDIKFISLAILSERDFGWAVEAIDFDNEGICYRALFTGPDAEKRAREYADWKNSLTHARSDRGAK